MTEFEQIYREHFDTVYKFLIRLCRNEPLAEELAQETFFRALRSLSKFDGRCRRPKKWRRGLLNMMR